MIYYGYRYLGELVKEKLNKEIAKIPVMSNEYTYSGEPIYYCPNCGDNWNQNEYHMAYCWECGQKLNWEGID